MEVDRLSPENERFKEAVHLYNLGYGYRAIGKALNLNKWSVRTKVTKEGDHYEHMINARDIKARIKDKATAYNIAFKSTKGYQWSRKAHYEGLYIRYEPHPITEENYDFIEVSDYIEESLEDRFIEHSD